MQSCCTFKRLQYIACFILALTILTILLILFFFNYPTMARRRVVDEVVFKNNTDSMARFQTTRDLKNLRMSFYLFNVTNADEVVNTSAKIKLKEIGPFVYDEYKYKELIDNNQTSGLITYKLYRRYTYNKELSVGDPKTTQITWINVPLIVARDFLDRLNPWLERPEAYFLLNALIKADNETSFITDTAENFLFTGSKRKLFEDLQKLDKFKFINPWPLKDNMFALLYDRNNTWKQSLDHEMTVSAGFGVNQTYKDLNKYVYIDGKNTTSYWSNNPPNCNAVGGTDGEFFSPFLDKEQKLEVYSNDICRKLSFKFDERSYISGVPASQYSLDPASLQAPSNSSMNRCYCIQKEESPECRLNGLIDLSKCNQPNVIASGAHFIYGSTELLTKVDGLTKPDANIHAPIIHVEPNTGLAVKVKVPLQFNIKLEKGGFKIFDWVVSEDPVIVPLVWVEEMSELTESQASLLKSKLLLLDSWLVTMVLGGAIVFIATIMAVATILCLKYRESRSAYPLESDLLVEPVDARSSSSKPTDEQPGRADSYQTF